MKFPILTTCRITHFRRTFLTKRARNGWKRLCDILSKVFIYIEKPLRRTAFEQSDALSQRSRTGVTPRLGAAAFPPALGIFAASSSCMARRDSEGRTRSALAFCRPYGH